MNENRIELKIDEDFRSLIPPLSIDEKIQLEENIINEGLREPICIWNGYIIDGHNRYEICIKNNIPYTTKNIELSNKDEVIGWICSNQLGRRNISEETKKYLIGKKYEAEKRNEVKNPSGFNQWNTEKEPSLSHSTAHKLGDEFHMSHQTVLKYGAYARAIDELSEKAPEITPKILSGDVKISHDNLLTLSRMDLESINDIEQQLSNEGKAFVRYSDSRKSVTKNKPKGSLTVEGIPKITIKQMPQYDPDAELASLTLTIPSWNSSIERVLRVTEITKCTEKAKEKLLSTLIELKKTADKMVDAILEG